MLNKNRAQLRGKKLDIDCKKAKISTNECGCEDKRKFCYGLEDASTQYLIPKCCECGAHVSNATCGRKDVK